MQLWSKWLPAESTIKANKKMTEDQKQLIQELRRAQAEWLAAEGRLNFVSEDDQIDYAIYAFETAKKRYELLLRQAKQMQISTSEWYVNKVTGT